MCAERERNLIGIDNAGEFNLSELGLLASGAFRFYVLPIEGELGSVGVFSELKICLS
jgi:hypothetical protein